MSNHSGSYMLRSVLYALQKKEVFETLGKEQTYELVQDILKIGRNYDCNDGEILEDIGEDLQICYYCLKQVEGEYDDGLCPDCQNE